MTGDEIAQQPSIGLSIQIPAGGGAKTAQQLSRLAISLQELAEDLAADLEYPDSPGFGSYIRNKKKEEQARANDIGAWKRCKVYYIPAFDRAEQRRVFFYAIASAALHDKMIQSLSHGDLPPFAVIVAKGIGEPSTDMKHYVRDYYGFDHEFVDSIANLDDVAKREAEIRHYFEGRRKTYAFELLSNSDFDVTDIAAVLGNPIADEYRQWLMARNLDSSSSA